MFENDLILKALEAAIVKAFFEGYTVYDDHGSRTVGGQFRIVVEKVLAQMNFTEIADEIAKRIKVDKKEEILKLGSQRFQELIFKGDWKAEIRPEIMKAMGKVIVEVIEKSPAFIRSIEKLIDLKNYEVNIQVKAVPKKGKR